MVGWDCLGMITAETDLETVAAFFQSGSGFMPGIPPISSDGVYENLTCESGAKNTTARGIDKKHRLQ
jgi:hypothetical protein